MKALLAICLSLAASAWAEEIPPALASPNKAYSVIEVRDGIKPAHYVIQSQPDGTPLGVCPDDARFDSTPAKVIWSPDSRFVAIETRMTRHGGRAEIWRLDGRKATLLKTDYPTEAGNFYFSPTRWLSGVDLEFGVIGHDEKAAEPENPIKTYTLIMRFDRKKGIFSFLRSTKATYGHF
ncbi:MAG: hypothetical protein QM755_16165 [Luteolibacter sp.]